MTRREYKRQQRYILWNVVIGFVLSSSLFFFWGYIYGVSIR